MDGYVSSFVGILSSTTYTFYNVVRSVNHQCFSSLEIQRFILALCASLGASEKERYTKKNISCYLKLMQCISELWKVEQLDSITNVLLLSESVPHSLVLVALRGCSGHCCPVMRFYHKG